MNVFLFSSSNYKNFDILKYTGLNKEDCTTMFDDTDFSKIICLINESDLVVLIWDGDSKAIADAFHYCKMQKKPFRLYEPSLINLKSFQLLEE